MLRATEYQHQKALFEWSRQAQVRHRWPELALLYHIKNETTEGAKQVAIDRAGGVKKGVPDLFLPVGRSGYHGLYIEMKRTGGRMSDEQGWWIVQLQKQGYCCHVCYGWQQAADVLEDYLDGKEVRNDLLHGGDE